MQIHRDRKQKSGYQGLEEGEMGSSYLMGTEFQVGKMKKFWWQMAVMVAQQYECKSYHQPRQHTKKQRHYFANKRPSSQGYGFSSSHVWMWELDYKQSWVPKNWCFWTEVLEKTLESPLDCKEIQPVHPEGNQSCVFIGRTDAEAEAPILWPPDVRNWLIRKYPDAGKDWRWEEKGMTEDEMVGWHCQFNGYELKHTLGDSE